MKLSIAVATVCLAAASPAVGQERFYPNKNLTPNLPGSPTLSVTSPGLGPDNTLLGEDFPGLAWSGAPAGAKSYLVFAGGDSGTPTYDFVTFCRFNLAADVSSLVPARIDETAPGQACLPTYAGLKRPFSPTLRRGSRSKEAFVVVALNRQLDLSVIPSQAELEAALEGFVVAWGRLPYLGRDAAAEEQQRLPAGSPLPIPPPPIVAAPRRSRPSSAFQPIATARLPVNEQLLVIAGLHIDGVVARAEGRAELARRLFAAGAAKGHAPSKVQLGEMLLRGEGGPVDAVQAERLFQEAAASGHPDGKLRSAEIALQRKNKGAAEAIRSLAEAGHRGAMRKLSQMYESGDGVRTNRADATMWSVYAGFLGDESLPQIDARVGGAERRVAAIQRGYAKRIPASTYIEANLAFGAAKGGDAVPPQAEQLLQQAVAAGYRDAATTLAVWRVGASDLDTQRRGAELIVVDANVSPASMCYLSVLYDTGRGIQVDDTQSLLWAAKSASEGYVPALLRLAYAYDAGVGVVADPVEAERWLMRAVALKLPNSYVMAADAYRSATALPFSPGHAQFYQQLASRVRGGSACTAALDD